MLFRKVLVKACLIISKLYLENTKIDSWERKDNFYLTEYTSLGADAKYKTLLEAIQDGTQRSSKLPYFNKIDQVMSSIKTCVGHYHQPTAVVFHGGKVFTNFVGMAILNGLIKVKILLLGQIGGEQVFLIKSITCLKLL